MKKLMILVSVLVLLASPALAAEWNFYGSSRVSTFVTDFERDPFNGGAHTDKYDQVLHGNARIGANVKANDELTGQFEYGALGGNADLRILWGEWDFGAGSLGVGKHYTPLLFPYSNQVYNLRGLNQGDTNMSAFGMLYGSRKAMIRLKFGEFQIAAVESRNMYTNQAFLENLYGWNTEGKMPSIQAKYRFAPHDMVSFLFAGGYSTFDITAASGDYSVDSWILGAGAHLTFGPAYLKGNIWGGQNVGNMVDILVNNKIASAPGRLDGDGWGYAAFDGTKVTDRDAIAGMLVAGYEIRKGLYVEAGYGYARTELDAPGASKDDVDSLYLQTTIFLAPGVFLTPEVGRHDFRQDNDADIIYYGVKWQINF